MLKWAKYLLLIPIVFLALFFIIIAPIATILPHQRVTIGLPFETTDPPTRIVPMGETVDHPKPQVPNGHPGIDFQWDHSAKILAAADGKVTQINPSQGDEGWDVEIVTGVYAIRYKEMDDYNNLKVGDKVARGSLVGRPHGNKFPDGRTGYQLHWEFASISLLKDRFCPETYFDAESRKIIDSLWKTVGYTYNGQFPYLCSGDYYNKAE